MRTQSGSTAVANIDNFLLLPLDQRQNEALTVWLDTSV
jgi:hypothetical protein